MNLRKENLAELILIGLDQVKINEDSLIILRLPEGVPTRATTLIGESLVSALRAIGANNPVILLPYDIKIQTLDEKDMKELGWIKDVETTSGDANNSGLQGYIESPKVTIPLNEQRRIWRSQVTELLAKLHDTNPSSTVSYFDN